MHDAHHITAGAFRQARLLKAAVFVLVAAAVAEGAHHFVRTQSQLQASLAGVSAESLPAPASVPAEQGDSSASDPSLDLVRMQRRIDSLFNPSAAFPREAPGTWSVVHGFSPLPDMDLSEDGDSYIARMDAPSGHGSKVMVHLEGQRLAVAGTRESRGPGHRRLLSRFERILELPGPVEGTIESSVKDGVLTLRIEKDKARGSEEILLPR